MNNYQLTLLVKDSLEEKERKELLETITKKMGKVEKEDLWGTKNLAYPILHLNKAFYAHYEFTTEPENIVALDKLVKLDEDIIRYIILRRD